MTHNLVLLLRPMRRQLKKMLFVSVAVLTTLAMMINIMSAGPRTGPADNRPADDDGGGVEQAVEQAVMNSCRLDGIPHTSLMVDDSSFWLFSAHSPSTPVFFRISKGLSRQCSLVEAEVGDVLANSAVHTAFHEFVLNDLCPSIARDIGSDKMEKEWRWVVKDPVPWFANRAPVELRMHIAEVSASVDTAFLHMMYSLYAGHSLDQLLYTVGRAISVFAEEFRPAVAGVSGPRQCKLLFTNFSEVHPSRYLFFNLNMDLLRHVRLADGSGCELVVLPFFSVVRYQLARHPASASSSQAPLWLPSNKVAFVQRMVCQDVARIALWRGVRASFSSAALPESSGEGELVAIIKSTRQANAFTARFFDMTTTAREEIQKCGIMLLPEDIKRARRMWLIGRAKVLIDSSGANREINTVLQPSDSPRLTHRISLVHPDAEPFMQKLCGTSRYLFHGMGRVQRGHGPMIRQPRAVWTHVCPGTADLSSIDWKALVAMVPTNISYEEELGGQATSFG